MSLWDKRKESGIENVNHDQQDDVQEVESRSTAGSTQLEDSTDHVNVLTDYVNIWQKIFYDYFWLAKNNHRKFSAIYT